MKANCGARVSLRARSCVKVLGVSVACIELAVAESSGLAGIPSVAYSFEVSNEMYLQGGLDQNEYADWVLLDLELDFDFSLVTNELKRQKLFWGIKFGAGYDSSESDHELEEYFIGYQLGNSQFGYGAKEYATEHYGIDSDINFGRKTTFEQVEDRGKNVFFYEYNSTSTLFSYSTDQSTDIVSHDAFIQYIYRDVWRISAAYQRFENRYSGEEIGRVSTLGLALDYQPENISYHYSVTHNKVQMSHDLGAELETSRGHKFGLSCGYEFRSRERNYTQCFGNISYLLSDNLYVIAELGYLDAETVGVGYLMGIEFEF